MAAGRRGELTGCPIKREADYEASASGGLSPDIATMVENSVAGERQSKPESFRLACCNERFEQPIANARRNSRPGIFDFDKHIINGLPGYNAELPPARHSGESVCNQVKEYALDLRAYQRQLHSRRHIDKHL